MLNNETAIRELSLILQKSCNLTEGQKRTLREVIQLLGRNETMLKGRSDE